MIDPPQLSGDDLDAGDFRVLDFEYRNGYGWTVQNVSCNPGSGTVNCVRWAQIDLAANTIADAGVFSISGLYTLHPDLAVNRCNDLLVGFSLSGSTINPSAWVAGRESDDTAGTLSFSQAQVTGSISYSAFDGEPLRWGDYTGATVGPDGASLWYLGQRSAVVASGPSNWSTNFTRYTFPDSDSDGVPDSCDICSLGDDDLDSDNDGTPNACDVCSGSDDSQDADNDDVPDGCDTCEGDDATGNSDGDAYCNDIDICSLGDDDIDSDDDSVPDACDACTGDDATGNSDGDAYCNDLDICSLGDDDIDTDNDDTPNACDPCSGPDNVDADDDGVCDSLDICLGDDATGDVDGDDDRCADLDCNDNNSNLQDSDRCGVCGGDDTSCLVLFPLTNEFLVTSTTDSNQTAPSIAAGDDGFLVTWTSNDASGTGIRGRYFTPTGSAVGDDFAINQTTDGSQDYSAVSPVTGGGYIVAWQSDNVDGNRTGIAGHLVDGGLVGTELLLNSSTDGGQRYPSLAPSSSGFQAAWESFDFDAGGSGVAERQYLADGTPEATDGALTGVNNQTVPDIAALPSGALVTWIDESSGVRVRPLNSSGVATGSEVQADDSGQSVAVAADGTGVSLVTWADPDGDGLADASVFARRVDSDGQTLGSITRVSPSANFDQDDPDVAALSGGGFLVVYADQQTGDVRAQLYESDGSLGVGGISGALVDDDPFAVNQDGSSTATAPAVAVDDQGTFFVVWSDTAIDGNGTGIAGRLFGTDADADAIAGAADNCPLIANANQADADSDGAGDVCDACAGFDDNADADEDDTADGCDTCTDTDGDGAGDPGYAANTCATDNCPNDANADQADTDNDGVGDVCDNCVDSDNDGAGDPGIPENTCATDNCPDIANADQADADSDGAGDVCDTCTDTDNDGAGDPGFGANTCATDNCPNDANADQADTDLDGTGDVCDTCTDTDDDGAGDPGFNINTCATDNCPSGRQRRSGRCRQ